MTRMTRPDCAVICNLINAHTHTHTHTHTHKVSLIPPWEDQCEWHRITRMTRPDCAVMCNLINTHTHKHTPGKSTNVPSLFPLRPLSPSRASKAAAGGAQQRLAARREAKRQRAAARRQLRREQQAAVSDVLQQEINEYLASFDPEKPLYQDGWAMGKMQENFQRRSQSMCNLCCLVFGAVVHRCGVLESRTLRVSFAMHAVRTCKCTFFSCGSNRH